MAGGMRQPFVLHVAEQYARGASRSATGGCARPRRRPSGRGSGAGCSPAAIRRASTASRCSAIRREQGRLAELAPAVRVLAALGPRGGVAARASPRCWPSSACSTRRAPSSTGSARTGSTRCAPALWLASLTYLADVCALVGDAEMAELVYPSSCRTRGSSVMIGHGVACYGAADRYLGMLAATFGDRGAGGPPFRGGARRSTARWARARGSPTPPTSTGGCSPAATPATPAGRPSCWPRRPSSRSGSACGRCSSGSQPGRARRSSLPRGLSAREVEILRLVARGLSNREIGRALSISEHTAANHIRSILRKTGAANRTEAAAYAHANGLIGAGVTSSSCRSTSSNAASPTSSI